MNLSVSMLLSFVLIYLCKTAFSTIGMIKNKYHSRLKVEANLRVAVSNIKPNLESIMSNIQAQVSHETICHFTILKLLKCLLLY